MRGAKVFHLASPRAIGPSDIAGAFFVKGDGEGAVFAVIGHDLATKPGKHIAAGIIGDGSCDPARGDAVSRMARAGAAVLVGVGGSAFSCGGFRVSSF